MKAEKNTSELHLIERIDHVFKLQDGSGLWASGYWELTEAERSGAKFLFLHRLKSRLSHFGGEVVEIRPAADFATQAAKHQSPTDGRWVILVKAKVEGKDVPWKVVVAPAKELS